MNKIFKIIWSKARNCYVVVSELAKSHDNGHVRRSRSGCCRKAAVLAAFVLTTSLLAVPDWAQAAAANTGNASANQAVNIEDKTETTAQGSDAYATYDSQGNLIVGKDNQVSPIQQDPKTGNARVDSKPENVVLGTRNGVGKFTHSTETKKPISGDASYAYEKLDTEWITVKVYNPDTNSYDDKQVEVYKLTPGQYMDDEHNVRAKYPERSYYSTDEDYRKAVEVYNNVATYYGQDQTRQSYYTSGATAVGVDNVAEGDHSTAIGNKAKVLNSVSSYYVDAYGKLTSNQADARFWLDEQGNITNSRQGYYASDGTFVDRYYMVPRLIDSSDAVAIGSDVTAEGRSAVAIGHQSYAKEYSVAIGENSVTDYMGVAIGKDNKAKYASTAIGHTNDANGYYTATMGVNNTARADESTAIGYGNSVDGQQNGGTTPKAAYTHVLGSNNTVKGNYNAVFGDTNTVTGAYALALGDHNKISGENTVGADGDYGIAIGYGNTVEKNALALGVKSNSIHDGSIAIGNQVNTTGDNNNGATDSIAIGTKASVHMKNGIVLGNEAYAGNNGDNSEGAIAIGHQARSAAGESIAIGTQATTGNNVGSTGMTNIGAIAIGSNSTADTVYDIAMGWGANTKNTANGGAIALGHNATIEQGGQASAAIGDSARVRENLHDAVALGSQSYAERTANNQGGYDPESNSENHNAGSDPVWNSTLAAVSVGSSDHYVWDGTKNIHYAQQTRQITNVAAGKKDTDAVNVAQLKQVVNLVHNSGGSGTGGSLAGKHTTVSVGGNKATADDTLVKGGNLELKRHTTDGQANYDVALSKDVILGEQEEHKGGSLIVNSVAQFRTAPGSKETYPVKEAVKIDGTTVSVVKNDGTNDQRQVVLGIGQDTGGYVALFDKTGNTPTYIFNAISPGITYLKEGQANEFKRLEYGDITNGSTQFIATLDDGLKFSGDQGTTSAVKLNQKLTVTGGTGEETNPDNLVTANNIGVVSSQDGDNGKLEIKLNKDLTGLNTVTAGTAKIGHYADGVLPTVQNGSLTGGHAATGDYVTGLTNKEWNVKDPTYVSGRAATEDELRIVSDAVSGNTTNIENNKTQITNNTNTIAKGLSFTTNTKDASNTTENYNGYKVVKRNLGDTIAIKASDETGGHSYSTANLTTHIAENGDISILMDEKPTFTTVTTGDVIYTGNPDKKDNNGKAAQADTSVNYGDKTLTDGKNITTSDNETKATRLGYDDAQGKHHDIATMDDGQIYAGDIKTDGTLDNTGFARTMNQKTTINGGVTSKDSLTDNNIGVVSNGTDTLTVKLAKDLKDLHSVTKDRPGQQRHQDYQQCRR